MTRSIRGRAAVVLVGAATAATALLVSGCGAGQIAETAAMQPAVSGVNVQTADNAFKIRNLAVSYPGTTAYPAGGNAPLEVAIYNDSPEAVTVRVSSPGARAVELTGSAANPSTGATSSPSAAGTPSAGAAPSGAASASPSAATASPAGGPASIAIPSGGYVVLDRSSDQHLRLVGLDAGLAAGQSVELVFDFGGQQLRAAAPVAVPLTEVPRATPIHEEGEGGHG